MGEKDLVQKLLEDCPDVFADIYNVLLFQGCQIIKAEDLHDTKNESQYKADTSKMHEERRDLLKLWSNGKQKALLGIENQIVRDHSMPFRVIGYDGVSYRSQVLKSWEGERCPVITLVLYFGEKRWEKPRSIAEELPEITNLHGMDYKIHVFEIPLLTDEQVQMFQSDFRIIAEFFAAQRKGEKYEGTTRKIQHVDEMLKFMAVFTEDHRFLEVKLDDKEKEGTNMCAILDQIERRGMEAGMEAGRKSGRKEGIKIGKKLGRKSGKNDGIQSVSKLIGILIQQGETDKLEMLGDQTYCEELLKKYHLL